MFIPFDRRQLPVPRNGSGRKLHDLQSGLNIDSSFQVPSHSKTSTNRPPRRRTDAADDTSLREMPNQEPFAILHPYCQQPRASEAISGMPIQTQLSFREELAPSVFLQEDRCPSFFRAWCSVVKAHVDVVHLLQKPLVPLQ